MHESPAAIEAEQQHRDLKKKLAWRRWVLILAIGAVWGIFSSSSEIGSARWYGNIIGSAIAIPLLYWFCRLVWWFFSPFFIRQDPLPLWRKIKR